MTIGGLSVKLKVCGMRDPANIRQVAALGPDYMGFIFYPPSSRGVELNFKAPEGLSPRVRKVGVFVNEAPEVILATARNAALDMIQLHGAESPATCEQIRSHGLPVIKAFAIDNEFDFADVDPYRSVANYFLFDTKGRGYGGTGRVFDWNLLKKYDQQIPFFLGGGLHPGNIGEVENLRGMHIHAVDVNSGFEVSPGVKSVEMIKNVLSPKSNV